VTGARAAVAAQAKVNLFLRILAREASGYHQIETLFCRLTLADDVVVHLRSGWSIECDSPDTGPAEDNLGYRAARHYAAQRGWPPGCGIEITKRIPVGGGLGGGSADAGAVLRCLRALDPNPPSVHAIAGWAARLGADVPALTLDSPLALGWGRGDRLLSLRPLPPRPVVLYVPSVRIATRDAYGWIAASRVADTDDRARPARDPIDITELDRWDTVVPIMANDFTSIVGDRYPEIASMTARLGDVLGTQAVLLSGSGSTVYSVFNGPIADPWPLASPAGGRFVMTATADHVVGVRRIE
jgi:4-diphosphocytidyl-2-C-methyl-D-erythritol kinase